MHQEWACTSIPMTPKQLSPGPAQPHGTQPSWDSQVVLIPPAGPPSHPAGRAFIQVDETEERCRDPQSSMSPLKPEEWEHFLIFFSGDSRLKFEPSTRLCVLWVMTDSHTCEKRETLVVVIATRHPVVGDAGGARGWLTPPSPIADLYCWARHLRRLPPLT